MTIEMIKPKFILDMVRPLEIDIEETGRTVTIPRYTVFDETDYPLESSNDLEGLQKRYGGRKPLPIYRQEPKKKDK